MEKTLINEHPMILTHPKEDQEDEIFFFINFDPVDKGYVYVMRESNGEICNLRYVDIKFKKFEPCTRKEKK